jgi:P-type Ca2+ transporter type 2C
MPIRNKISNMYSNRRLDNKLNVFEGLHRNWYFIGINMITVTGQVLIVSFGGSALSATRLSGIQWVVSLVLGAMCLPVAVLIRLIPNSFIKKFLPSTVSQSLSTGNEESIDDDHVSDEELRRLRTSFRIRRNSRLGPLPMGCRTLRELWQRIRERGWIFHD